MGFSRRFNEPFPLPDSWSSYQRLRDFLDTFLTRSSVLEICETLNNGVFIEKKKKPKTCSGRPDPGWELNAFVSIPNPGPESGKLFVLAECRIPPARGSSAFRTGTVSTHFFSNFFFRKKNRPFGAVGCLFDSTFRFTI